MLNFKLILDAVCAYKNQIRPFAQPTCQHCLPRKTFCNQGHRFSMHSKAIVIGSGMGGLAAAQVLSRHFEQVVVVERDRPQPLMHWSALDAAIMQEGARPGVKQVSHGSMHACNQGLHGGPASSSTAVGPSAAVATAAVLSQRVLHNLVQQLMRDLDRIMHSNIRCMCKCQLGGLCTLHGMGPDTGCPPASATTALLAGLRVLSST